MRFIENGPNLPVEILQAQEDGELVFFCGAGISMRAGLPSFRELVEKLYTALGTTRATEEEREWTAHNYDRVLNHLERRFPVGRLRSETSAILATPPNPELATHSALIELAKDRSGIARLVTTNFDKLFQEVDPSLPTTSAPLLPVPKPHKWNALVHLHGCLSNAGRNGQHLVLTSADFGTAYLVERWASRFVSELFNHFNVLFVGYGVDDPVMRYLVDSLAAERTADARIRKAYALVGCPPVNEDVQRQKWLAKGITPIIYNSQGRHRLLHETLETWSEVWRRGLTSKRSLVLSLGPQLPQGIPDEDISQLCWAVAHRSGSMARVFASLGASAPLGWLRVFEDRHLLDRPSKPEGGVRVPLVDDGTNTHRPPDLDPVTHALGVWLTSHLASRDLIDWSIQAGGRFHPAIAQRIAYALSGADSNSLPDAFRKLWRFIAGSTQVCQRTTHWEDPTDLFRRIATEEWSPQLKADLTAALSPCVKLGPRWLPELDEPGADDRPDEDLRIWQLVAVDCKLRAGDVALEVTRRLRAREDWEQVAPELGLDMIGALRRTLDLFAALEHADRDRDLSYVVRPSIAAGGQARDDSDWRLLIDLLRETVDISFAQDPTLGANLVRTCAMIPYPAFRRIVLYSALENPTPNERETLEQILGDPRSWLWSPHVERELFGLLPSLWAGLDEPDRASLLRAIEAGPPRNMYREGITEEEFETFRDEECWRRLSLLREAEPPLDDPEALTLISEIEARQPELAPGAEAQDRPIETGWGRESDYSIAELSALGDEELLEVLLRHETNRGGLVENWQYVVAENPGRGIRILSQVGEEEPNRLEIYRAGLRGLRELPEDEVVRNDLLNLFEQIDEACMQYALHESADLVASLAEGVPEEQRKRTLDLWDRVLVIAPGAEVVDMRDRMTTAINHPLGTLAKALFDVLRSRDLEVGESLPEDVRDRVERLLAITAEPGRLARVIAASRLSLLHAVDPEWADANLIPLFEWEENAEEAPGAWEGFLWAATFRPSLWARLKPNFISTFGHIEELHDSEERLADLLAAVALEGDEVITAQEIRICLSGLSDSGRAIVARSILRRFEGVDDRSAFWRDRVAPWLHLAWPQETALRGPAASDELARLAIATGSSFPNATDVVAPLVDPIVRAGFVTDALEEAGHLEEFPEAALELLNRLVPPAPEPWWGPLGRLLDRIEAARPELTEDERFRRLREIATDVGLE